MIISITGHRPEDIINPQWVEKTLEKTITNLNPTTLLQGMAAGIDLLSAEICIKHKIPYICVKPWAGHSPRNNQKQQYKNIENNSQQIINTNPSHTYPGVHAYHTRNHYMVDNSDLLIAVWTGKTTGGTAECVKYAKKQNKHIIHINPKTQTITEVNNEPLF